MKYMLLIYSSETAWTKEWTACTVKSTALCHELSAKGQFRAASPLHPVSAAKSVRVRDGQRMVTAGPFAETVEQLGGYYIIDVPNLDEAITFAGRIPAAEVGTVEIRPLLLLPELPPERRRASLGNDLKVMLICYDDEQAWLASGKETHIAAMREAAKLAHELDAQGKYLTASPLHPASTATSVRVRDGKRIVTDGPFAETREVLGGYYLLSVKDMDDAVEIAARHPGIPVGTVEIRPVYELPNIPIDHDCEIVSSRELPFPRSAVFDAFSKPDRLARWWGPKGFRNTFEQFDFRAGGEWRFVMHGPDGTDYPNYSVFEAVTAPERIAFNHVSAPHFDMEISLDELSSDRSRIVWRMRFETAAVRDAIAKFAVDANEQNFDRLIEELQSSSSH